MTKRHGTTGEGKQSSLRHQAEARAAAGAPAEPTEWQEQADTAALVHELRVHEIELELQNEELLRSQRALEGSVADFTELFELAPLGYLTLARDGTIARINQTGSRLLGEDRSRLVDRPFGQFVAEKQRLAGLLAKAWTSGAPETCELTIPGPTADPKGGATVQLTVLVRPSRDQCLAVAVDLTERRRTEEQLRAAMKMEAVGQLAGGVAHDFNNLLTVILGNTEFVLAQLAPGDPMHDDLAAIRAASQHAAELTQQLLAFGRRQMITPQVVDINDVTRDCATMLRRVLPEDVELVLELADGCTPIRIDPVQLRQVLMNLSVNARDAMPDGGTLTVSTRRLDDGARVRVSVRDTGTGMDEATQARIFEPFFTTKPMGRGTGLGLSTTYGVVRQCRGTIAVRSAPGEGTTFDIDLPGAPPQANAVAPASRGARLRGGGETILIVEDQEALRHVARRILSHAGYAVIEAESGIEALRLCSAHPDPIDLVLSDVIMPGMAGTVFVDRLRQTHSEIRILFMSGYPADEINRRGVQDGSSNFISKPFSAHDLLARVRGVLDQPIPGSG